jgi:hypothetical protein
MHSNELHKCIKSYPVRQINLSGNKITDSGVDHILKAVALSSGVEAINLANNKISDKCVENIVYTLRTCKSLK